MSAAVSKQKGYTTNDVKTWLQRIKKRKTEAGAPFVKPAQFEMLKKVCDRVCAGSNFLTRARLPRAS
eukprot:370318-Karenia_brevis.AAC.1